MKKSPRTAELLRIHRLKRELKTTQRERDYANEDAAHCRRRAAEADDAAMRMDAHLRRNAKLVRAIKWKPFAEKDIILRWEIRIPEHQVIQNRDAEIIWAETLGQMGFESGSKLAEYSMRSLRRGISKINHSTFQEAKRDWMFAMAPTFRSDHSMLDKAWDAAVGAIMAEVKFADK